MNIHEITAKYEQLITEQKQTMKTMDKLINLAEQVLLELQIRNGGHTNASN
jgi:hypothetical protein